MVHLSDSDEDTYTHTHHFPYHLYEQRIQFLLTSLYKTLSYFSPSSAFGLLTTLCLACFGLVGGEFSGERQRRRQ